LNIVYITPAPKADVLPLLSSSGTKNKNIFLDLLKVYPNDNIYFIWHLDTCPKNDVILFCRKRFCALGLGLRLGLELG